MSNIDEIFERTYFIYLNIYLLNFWCFLICESVCLGNFMLKKHLLALLFLVLFFFKYYYIFWTRFIVSQCTVYQAAQPLVLVKLNSISKYYIDENHISASSVQKNPRIRTGGTGGLEGQAPLFHNFLVIQINTFLSKGLQFLSHRMA